MTQRILKYILRVLIFIVLTGFLLKKTCDLVTRLFGELIVFLYGLVPIFQNLHSFEMDISLLGYIMLILIAVIITPYFFIKICGLFKELEGLKKWQIFPILLLLSLILYGISMYCLKYPKLIDFSGNMFFAGLDLIPAYLMYLFLNRLTRKHPVPFKAIGYLCSIEFVKDLIIKRKYYFSSQFVNDVIGNIKVWFLKYRDNLNSEEYRKFKKTKTYIFSKIILIIMIIFQVLLYFYSIHLQNSTSTYNKLYSLAILTGCIICFILYKKIRKMKRVIYYTILMFIISLIFYKCEFSYFTSDSIGECAHGYCSFLSYLTSENNKYNIAHLPKTLPKNVTNYKSFYDWSAIEENNDYARFNCDLEDIEKIIDDNRKNIKDEMPYNEYNELSSSRIDFKVEDKEKYNIYIMKNSNDNDNYTSGIVASKEKKEIIFFFVRPKIKYTREKGAK